MLFKASTDMNIYTHLVILFGQLVLTSIPSPSPPSEMAKLNKSALLPCHVQCPGSVRWIMDHKRRTVAQCNQTDCHPEDGFNISHDQYLKGNVSLTITAADYSKRTWYTCQCDGKSIRRVYLRIERIDYSKQIEHGDSFTVDFSISERVKITFNRTGNDGSQKPVTLYESSGNEVHHHPEYEKRALSKSSFTLKDVRDSDSGVYAVWDTDNVEIIATYTLTVTAKKSDDKNLPPVKGEESYGGVLVGSMFCAGLVLGVLLHRYGYPRILQLCDWLKKKIKGSECDYSTAERNEDSVKNPLNTVPKNDLSSQITWSSVCHEHVQ